MDMVGHDRVGLHLATIAFKMQQCFCHNETLIRSAQDAFALTFIQQ